MAWCTRGAIGLSDRSKSACTTACTVCCRICVKVNRPSRTWYAGCARCEMPSCASPALRLRNHSRVLPCGTSSTGSCWIAVSIRTPSWTCFAGLLGVIFIPLATLCASPVINSSASQTIHRLNAAHRLQPPSVGCCDQTSSHEPEDPKAPHHGPSLSLSLSLTHSLTDSPPRSCHDTQLSFYPTAISSTQI